MIRAWHRFAHFVGMNAATIVTIIYDGKRITYERCATCGKTKIDRVRKGQT